MTDAQAPSMDISSPDSVKSMEVSNSMESFSEGRVNAIFAVQRSSVCCICHIWRLVLGLKVRSMCVFAAQHKSMFLYMLYRVDLCGFFPYEGLVCNTGKLRV